MKNKKSIIIIASLWILAILSVVLVLAVLRIQNPAKTILQPKAEGVCPGSQRMYNGKCTDYWCGPKSGTGKADKAECMYDEECASQNCSGDMATCAKGNCVGGDSTTKDDRCRKEIDCGDCWWAANYYVGKSSNESLNSAGKANAASAACEMAQHGVSCANKGGFMGTANSVSVDEMKNIVKNFCGSNGTGGGGSGSSSGSGCSIQCTTNCGDQKAGVAVRLKVNISSGTLTGYSTSGACSQATAGAPDAQPYCWAGMGQTSSCGGHFTTQGSGKCTITARLSSGGSCSYSLNVGSSGSSTKTCSSSSPSDVYSCYQKTGNCSGCWQISDQGKMSCFNTCSQGKTNFSTDMKACINSCLNGSSNNNDNNNNNTTTGQEDECWGNNGTNGRCFDVNNDGTVNMIDFSCISYLWLKGVSSSSSPRCGK